MINGTIMEQHVQTIITTVMAGLVAWIGLSVSDNNEAIARMDERMKSLQGSVLSIQGQLSAATNDRYTATEAGRHRQLMVTRLNNQEKRIDELDRKIERIMVEYENIQRK